jgi:hypothetical protein
MFRKRHLSILALPLIGCASAAVKPDDMSAQAHRQEAAYERQAAAHRERQAVEQAETRRPDFDPHRQSHMGLDPASRLRWEAESRRAHALEHEAAASELERFEAQECAGIDPGLRAACPVLDPIAAIRDIPGGVRLDLVDPSHLPELLALMRCHLAYAQTKGFEPVAAACPLYIRGIQIRAAADGTALEIVGQTERLAKEIRSRSRSRHSATETSEANAR